MGSTSLISNIDEIFESNEIIFINLEKWFCSANLSKEIVFYKLHDKVVLDASLHLGDEADRALVGDVHLLTGFLRGVFLPQDQEVFVDASGIDLSHLPSKIWAG